MSLFRNKVYGTISLQVIRFLTDITFNSFNKIVKTTHYNDTWTHPKKIFIPMLRTSNLILLIIIFQLLPSTGLL